MRFYSARKEGFTLVEVVIVVAVIGILSSVVYASLGEARKKARDAQRKSDLEQIQLALRMYKDANNEYPDCATGMQIGGGQSTPAGCSENIDTALTPYLPKIPTDPFGTGQGNAYVYDSDVWCRAIDNPDTTKRHIVLYARQTEGVAAGNWSTVCGTRHNDDLSPPTLITSFTGNGVKPLNTSYGIILK